MADRTSRQALGTGQRTTVMSLGKPIGGGIALSPDERTLLVPLVDAEGRDLMVVGPRGL